MHKKKRYAPVLARRKKRERPIWLEALEPRLLLVSDWQNPLFRYDVDDDASVAPIDALSVINDINAKGARELITNADPNAVYIDVDGDSRVTAGDALTVINYINASVRKLDVELQLAADTGVLPDDLLTHDSRIAGEVLGAHGDIVSARIRMNRGPAVDVQVDADGNFLANPALAAPIPDGPVKAKVLVMDADGAVGLRFTSFTLDATGPAAPALILSAASGVVTSQTSSASRVTLVGVTEPGISVALAAPTATALANSTGIFQFDSVSLAPGDNVFATTATDLAGNVTQASTTIRRVDSSGQTDPVIRWNQAVLQAIRADATNPTFATRDLAMTQAAIYDVVNAIEGRTGYYVTLPAPTGISLEAAVSGAAYRVLSYLFPAQQTLFDATLTAALAQVPTGPAATNGVAFGQQVGDAIIALRLHDGWDNYVDYSPTNAPGHWQETAPIYAPALDPQWATMEPWAMATPDQFAPPGPPAINSASWATALNEVKSLGAANSTTRTADQTQIARFWSDGAGTASPPGHWNAIAEQAALSEGNSIAENARLFAVLNIALADAAITDWNAKYAYDFWRPITAIQNADTDGTGLTTADPTWQPLLITPNFPEYVSGHSTFSAAAATVLDAAFGNNYAFSTSSDGLIGVTRSFTSFDAAAAEAGMSRIYGGIHYSFSNQDGQAAGRNVANYVLQSFDTSSDAVAPRVFFNSQSGSVTNHNLTITGRALDNLSGVVSLTAAVDGGAASPVSFNSNGQFSFVTSLPLNGSGDGPHQVTFIANDAAGNTSSSVPFSFTLDTQAPVLQIDSPLAGSDLFSDATLSGTVNSGNSTIVELKYAFAGQSSFPVSFDQTTGQFNAPLDISKLAPGTKTLTISAKDAAGNTVSTTINVNLSARIPFTLSSFSPLDGANEIGSTYRPQIIFSRPVNPSSLTASNFYATDPSGAKLPANIVPSLDGTFAWLFFTQPMPSASQITVHVDGTSILAQADNAPLDADGNGTPGGMETFSFSTVSLTPLVGTSLSGKVLDTGTDLKPMTFDDIRAGADGVLHTPDDVFLTPLAGVKVSIVGLESQFVLTDANGNFHFDSVPAGDLKLAINGRTATNAPTGFYFPEMVMDLQLEAGRANTVMGTMGTDDEKRANRDRPEVYLPRLQTSILQTVSAATTTNLTVGPGGAPNLSPQQAAQLTLSVPAGALRDANGNPMSSAQIGVSTVPASLVRDMLPAGLLQHTFDITVQAPDVATFTAPVAMTFPNTFAAAPGTKLNFLSFDHTTGRLVIEGSATVSADGLTVATDPGTGVTHPGWHGITPNGSPTNPDDSTPPAANGTEFSFEFAENLVVDNVVVPNSPAASSLAATSNPATDGLVHLAAVPSIAVTGLKDYLLTKNIDRIRITAKNTTNPLKSDGSYVKIKFTVDPKIAQTYLDGFSSQPFYLNPGRDHTFDFAIKAQNVLKESTDVLIGVKVRVEMWQVKMSGVMVPFKENGDYYVYRYVDAMDDSGTDAKLKFADTLNDGPDKHVRTRPIEYRGDKKAAIPTLVFASADSADLQDFSARQFDASATKPQAAITFDPKQLKNNITASLQLQTPTGRIVDGTPTGNPQYIQVIGNGVAPREIYANLNGLIDTLATIANGNDTQTVSLTYELGRNDSGPPGTELFQLKYLDRVSENLPLNATKTAIEDQLKRKLAFTSSQFEVGESSTSKDVIDGRGRIIGKSITQKYTIKLIGVSPVQEFTIVKPNATDDFYDINKVIYDFNPASGRISVNERAQFDTLDKRGQFALDVYAGMQMLLKPYLDAGEVILSPFPGAGRPYSVNWTTTTAPTEYGANPDPSDLSRVTSKIKEVLKNRKQSNDAQNSFKMAEAFAQTGTLTINAFVDTHYELSYPDWDQSYATVIRELAQTAIHELGHSFGFTHTSIGTAVETSNEVQVLDLSSFGATESVRLRFAGEYSSEIQRSDATHQKFTATDILNALYTLSPFRAVYDPAAVNQELSVTGQDGGPFNIQFANSALDDSPTFGAINMPELLAYGASGVPVKATEKVPGGRTIGVDPSKKQFNRDHGYYSIQTVTSDGKPDDSLYDIMAAGNQAGVEEKFQEMVSRASMNLAVRGNWSIKDSKASLSAFAQHQKALSEKKPHKSSDPEPEIDFSLLDSDGPLLVLFDGGSQLIDGATDFGSASTVTPAVRHFTVSNLGASNATVRSIVITQGYDAFSVPAIPVTVLEPAESLDFDVNFAPNSVLDYTGTLSIDSDVAGFSGVYDLTGNGQPTNTPAIKLDNYSNFLGVPVGKLTSFAGSDSRSKLTNVGSAPLTISEIRVAAGQGGGDWATPGIAQPITLAPGESVSVPVTVRPSKTGLRPGVFEVLSNDPRTPILRIPVVATGVITHDNDTFDGATSANNYVAVDAVFRQDNLPTLHTRSDSGGNWEFFLSASTTVNVTSYDPVSGLVSSGFARTNASGVRTEIDMHSFGPSIFPDTDGDGLPDDVEKAIGTNPNRVDTDGDGKNDFAELDTGSNPLDDRPTVTGITAALSVGDKAHDVKLAPDFRDASRTLAYIATGTKGLSVADVTNFASPITIAQLALPGDINHVSIDPARKLLAASSPTGGVSFIDISDPSKPILLQTIANSGTDTTATVQLFDGLAYAAMGQKLRVFDAKSGVFVDEFALGDQIVQGMSQSGNRLYLTVFDNPTNQAALRYLDITATGLVASSSVAIPGLATPKALGEPVVADGYAWFTAGDRVVTVEVVHNFVVKSDLTLPQTVVNDVQLNGSGLGIASGLVGQQGGATGSAIVLQANDATQVNTVFTRFVLPATGEKSALSSGFAYVADGTGGLQLVNFLQLDSGSTPPTIQLDAIPGDIDVVKTGLQFYEGSSVSVPNHITDNVQVRNVELLVNGAVVLKDVSYPYDLTTTLPKIATSGPQAVLQVRATDTGGNITLSAPVVIDLVADTTPPAVLAIDPANGSNQPLSKRTVNIDLSEAIGAGTALPANFVLHGPTGDVTPVSVDLRRSDTRVAIVYPPLPTGDYQFTIHAAAVADRAGNPLGTSDLTYSFHVGAVAHPPTIRWVNTAGGNWNLASNWVDVATNAARLPTATDDVQIDVPTDALVTFSTGTVTVNSIVSNERLLMSAGTLNVTETIQVNNTFTLNGSSVGTQPTLKGTVLPGSGGQGLTLKGFAQLNGATVLTDITFANDPATIQQLTLQNGLALTGTATVTSKWIINVSGDQTISSGNFVVFGDFNSVRLTVQPVATSTLTLGHDVTMRGNPFFTNNVNTTIQLTVINQGTLIAAGTGTSPLSQVAANNTNFTNQGIIRNERGGMLNLLSTHFTNAATGKITVATNEIFINTADGVLGASSLGATFANAGNVEVVGTIVNVMQLPLSQGTWSNTGTISVDSQSLVSLFGGFTSDDLVNLRNAGTVKINGAMDNTARTFTFNANTGLIYLSDRGVIKGGTLVMTGPGPSQRLWFANMTASTLDGVTIQGDIDQGAPISGGVPVNNVHVINGLTLHGTWTARGQGLVFDGAQTISAGTGTGTLQLLQGIGGSGAGGFSAPSGGPVIIDSSLAIRVVSGSIIGYFTNNANIVMESDSSLGLSGINSLTPANTGPFDNRANITIASGTKFANLSLGNNFINEGSIVAHKARITAYSSYTNFPVMKNLGTIDISDGTELDIGGTANPPPTMKTADLGNLIASNTSVIELGNYGTGLNIDNSNATLAISGNSFWSIDGATITGGTIQVAPTAKLDLRGGILKDLVLNGKTDHSYPASISLAGDITVNGTLTSGRGLRFDDPTSSNVPVRIHSGTIDVQDIVLNGSQNTITDTGAESSIIIDAGAVLIGRYLTRANIAKPIDNHGTIVADRHDPSSTGFANDVFEFSNGPITNSGALSAVNFAILKIANLAAPNTGIVSASAGSSVQFTGAFAQAAAGTTHVDIAGTAADKFGLITVAAAATLAGTLDVKFASSYTPNAGDTYKILTYGSHTGTFATINVTGLASGLTVAPQYNSGDVTLVIGGTALAPLALIPPANPLRGAEGESAATNPAPVLLSSTNGPPSSKNVSSALQSSIPVTTSASSATKQVAVSEVQKNVSTTATDRIFASLDDDFLLLWKFL